MKETNKIMNGSERSDNSIKSVNSSKENIWKACLPKRSKAQNGVWKETVSKKR